MKKTRKKVLGIIGLALVAVMTVFAVLLPESGASALVTNPVTDEVEVRVVGNAPMISLVYPEDGAIFVDPTQYFAFEYANVETTTTKVYYTDSDGTEHVYTIDTVDPDYHPGISENYPLNLLGEEYGYGEYKIVTTGVGYDGVTTEDTVTFSFYPVYGDVEETTENGVYSLNLRYFEDSEDLDAIIVRVYDADGNLVTALSPIKVALPTKEVALDFAGNGLPSGDYTIEIIGVDANGEELSAPYIIDLAYNESKKEDAGDDSVPAPNTGRFFGAGNVSGSDAIVTGLITFVAVAIVAIVIVARTKRNNSNHKK